MTKQESFFEDVYAVVRLIPVGKVTSYGAIAEYLGSKQGARMVGWAMNNCHARPDVPAHRVLNKSGLLSGKHHFGGDRMQELLEKEGIIIENNQVVNLAQYYWNPSEELF